MPDNYISYPHPYSLVPSLLTQHLSLAVLTRGKAW